MKKFVFEGYSDDTFEECHITEKSYDNSASGKPIRFKLSIGDGSGIVVTGQYDPDNSSGCWMIGVHSLDEEKPVDWQITTKPSHGKYRNQLTVIAPDDTELTCLEEE